ncbi:MAG TPA: hypothetical protein VE173_12685 [Longimicrobiales bacterium]|nr:hypothetical protein [Longimicrobiales bacterium]
MSRSLPFSCSLAFLLLSATACGGEAAQTSETAELPEGTEQPAWSIAIEASADETDLPDLQGEVLDGQTMGTNVQINGLRAAGSLLIRFAVDSGGLEPGTYGPTTFSVTWDDLDHTCVGGSDAVTVTVEASDPLQGTIAGDVHCYPGSRPQDAFDARISGTFRETM